jgi:hypothetical protein
VGWYQDVTTCYLVGTFLVLACTPMILRCTKLYLTKHVHNLVLSGYHGTKKVTNSGAKRYQIIFLSVLHGQIFSTLSSRSSNRPCLVTSAAARWVK